MYWEQLKVRVGLMLPRRCLARSHERGEAGEPGHQPPVRRTDPWKTGEAGVVPPLDLDTSFVAKAPEKAPEKAPNRRKTPPR